MDSKIQKELIEQYSFYEIRDLLCECVRKHMDELDTDKVYELCNKIKRLMEEQSRTQLIVRSANIYRDSWDDDDDDDVNYEEDIDEDTYMDYNMDSDTRLVSYDCGGYSRALQLAGVVIEDDELLLYLIEVEMSYKGDNDRDCYKVSVEDFIDDKRNWWWAYNMPECIFNPIEALEYYVYLLTDKESPLFEEN